MACYINNVYKRSWWWGGICARIGGSNKGRFSFTYWQNLVDIQPSAGSPPSNSLQHTLAHNHTWKENNRKCLCSLLNFLPSELVRRGYGHFSRTSPLATHGGWGCRAQTSGACVFLPGLGAELSLSPPGRGLTCPHQQTPARPHKWTVWKFGFIWVCCAP